MSGGPLSPRSVDLSGASGRLFPNPHVGATNGRIDYGIGVEASLSADSTLQLRFKLPPVLPSGTPKLVLDALANDTTGDAKVNPSWASVAAEENPDTATLNAEGTSTLSWGAGDADVYKQLKITLNADTPVGGETIVMDLTFETTNWTLAVISTWFASVIWE